jgi:hypothetical protein
MTTPRLLVFPGASLMDITVHDDELVITCPGCHALLTVGPAVTGAIEFPHEDNCPVYARIRSALRDYERDVVRRG